MSQAPALPTRQHRHTCTDGLRVVRLTTTFIVAWQAGMAPSHASTRVTAGQRPTSSCVPAFCVGAVTAVAEAFDKGAARARP